MADESKNVAGDRRGLHMRDEARRQAQAERMKRLNAEGRMVGGGARKRTPDEKIADMIERDALRVLQDENASETARRAARLDLIRLGKVKVQEVPADTLEYPRDLDDEALLAVLFDKTADVLFGWRSTDRLPLLAVMQLAGFDPSEEDLETLRRMHALKLLRVHGPAGLARHWPEYVELLSARGIDLDLAARDGGSRDLDGLPLREIVEARRRNLKLAVPELCAPVTRDAA